MRYFITCFFLMVFCKVHADWNIGSNSSLNIATGVKVNISGNLNIASNGVLSNSGTIEFSGEMNNSGILINSGELCTEKVLNNVSNLNVGNLGAVISTTANMGLTKVTWGGTFQNVNENLGIARYYDILPSNNTNLDATLVFKYLQYELNENDEVNLKLYRLSEGSTFWTNEGGICDTVNNTITLSSIDSFSKWTAAENDKFPQICIDIDSLDFGYQTICADHDTTLAITIHNCGDNDLIINSISGFSLPFSYSFITPDTLIPGESKVLPISLLRNFSAGIYIDTLFISNNDSLVSVVCRAVIIPSYPAVNLGGDIAKCANTPVTIIANITGGSEPFSYVWNNGMTTSYILVNPSVNSTYSVMVTDSYGLQTFDTINITIQYVYEDEEICLVTVDEISGKNMVVWEKTPGVGTAYYNIYKDYNYNLIASVPYESNSTFVDYSSQPEKKRSTYWLSAVDSCGNESALSDSHLTMLLSLSLAYPSGILLSWNDYLGFPYEKFYIYKGVSPNNLVLIDSLPNDGPGQNYYPDKANPLDNVIYRVGVKKSVACYPSVNKAGPFKQSQSNIADNIVQTLSMQQGWNGISLSIIPDSLKMEDVFNPIINHVIIVKDLSDVFWPGQNINTIVEWDNNTGYAAKLDAACDLEIEGSFLDSTLITLTVGWHYLPVLNRCNTNSSELFGNQNENIIIVQDLIGSNVYWPEMNITTLTTVEPGKAYKIKVRNAFTLTFPLCNSKNCSVSSPSPNSITTNWGELKMNPFTHLLAFKDFSVSDFVVEGDQIGAFTQDNVLSGFLTVGDRKGNSTITLCADDPTTPDYDGYKEGEALNFRLFRPGTEETFDLDVEYDPNYDNDGTFKTNGISVISRVKQSALAMNEVGTGTIRIYPNPTEGMVELTFNGLTEKATIRVSDLQNKDYRHFEIDGAIQDQKMKLDLTALPPGVYLITVTGETFRFVKKIIVM